ncbi:MAG TPA: peroxiredoxin family protein [Gammaproteobacteria bacterium]|nr:peroxiredoxin family protein [Gammaproteobacteria bacterium]
MVRKTVLQIFGAFVALSAGVAAYAQNPGPAAGEQFPHALAAADQHGDARTLTSLMGDNGVAVLFVRSADWCPFCQRQLVDVNARLPEFAALGLNVVSVSVDEVAEIAAFAGEHNIAYTMLADPNGDINASLGIRDEQYPVGSAQFGVPRPTLYVIDRSGTIRLRYMEPTFRTRPDLDVVLEDAAGLKF